MLDILQYIKKVWGIVDKIPSEVKSLILIFLLGWIFYSQMSTLVTELISKNNEQRTIYDKKAEQYSRDTAIEINNQVQLIAEKDNEAFDVLLLNYHNNTQSLQGYKYLYLSCLTEAPRSLDTSTLKQQWNKIDYIYYADELAKIHGQSFVQFENIEQMSNTLPKLYRLVKASEAKAISFFTIEGTDYPIGLIVVFYKEPKHYNYKYAQGILPCIQKLALLLDYDRIKQ